MAQYLPARLRQRDSVHGFRRHGFGQVRRLFEEPPAGRCRGCIAARRTCSSSSRSDVAARRCQPVRQRGRGGAVPRRTGADRVRMSSRTASTRTISIPRRTSARSRRWDPTRSSSPGRWTIARTSRVVTWFVETILSACPAWSIPMRASSIVGRNLTRCGEGAGQVPGRGGDRPSASMCAAGWRRRSVGGRAAEAGAGHPN